MVRIRAPSEKARASEEALRPAVETTRGVLNNIAAAGSEFNKTRPRPVASDSPPSPHHLPGSERRCFDGSPSHRLGEGHALRGGDRRSPGLVGVPTESRNRIPGVRLDPRCLRRRARHR